MTNTITIKDSLANLTLQGASVKASSLNLTAAIIMAVVAYGDDNLEQARAAIRSNLIASGFVKMDKGTKQPSDKVRGFLNAAGAAVSLHGDKVRSIIASYATTSGQTEALAQWLLSFALSNNHYEGGVFLYPLVKGLSKKAAKEKLVAQSEADNQEEGDEESNVSKGKPKGAAPAKSADKPGAIMSDAASVSGIMQALSSLVRVPKGKQPSKALSAAVVLFFSNMDTVNRLVRGEDVKASKEVARLAVEVAKHLEAFKRSAKKAVIAAEKQAEKKAA